MKKKMTLACLATALAACLAMTACDDPSNADTGHVTTVYTQGDSSSSSTTTASKTTTKTLIDSTVDISAGYYHYVEFTTNKTATLTENITVNSSSGTKGVRVFLLDSNNFALFKNQYASLENAAAGFSYLSDFSAPTRTTSYSTSGNLSSGTYYLVIYNPNLLCSQNVTAKATLTH